MSARDRGGHVPARYFWGRGSFARGLFSLGLVLMTNASLSAVRQRTFLHDGKNSTTGIESIVHWDFSTPRKIEIHNWGSTHLERSSGLDYAAVRSVFGTALARWVEGINGTLPVIAFDLDGVYPYETSSDCEYLTKADGVENTTGDLINNILFTSKMLHANCSVIVPHGYGVIGLTKVRYNASNGQITEGDLQFDDTSFKFSDSGENDLSMDVINLNDVATHELGHFLGLDHATAREAAMIFSVAKDLEHPKDDDFSGLLSIYPPASLSSAYGTLQGSLTDGSSSPVFGAVVFAVNVRTMHVVASEMTDVNGAFSFCALPLGSYIVFANRYMPYGGNVHQYYSGDAKGGGTHTEKDGVTYCYNPSCEVMNREITHSFLSHAPTGTGAQGGLAMTVVSVDGTQASKFLNLTAQISAPSLSRVGGAVATAGSTLQLDEPRLARLSDSPLLLDGTGTLSSDVYSITAPQSGVIVARTASLRLFARVRLTLALYDANGVTMSCSNMATVLTADDAEITCSGLEAGSIYHLAVSGAGLSCRDIPGNFFGSDAESCETASIGEDASTPIPYYFLNVFNGENADLNDAHLGEAAIYESFSKASNVWQGFPTCSNFVGTVTKGAQSGSCCGSLGGSGPDRPSGPKSFLLGLLMSPLLWFAAAWVFKIRGVGLRL